MASFSTARVAWIVPVIAAAGVVAAAAVPQLASGSTPSLPERTPAQLLAGIASARVTGLSGTVVETARLGLPALPSSATAAATALTPQALLSGSHSARVAYAGPDRQRLALLGQLAETDFVHDGADIWTYESLTKTATHYSSPANVTNGRGPTAPVLTPQEAADRALAAVEPTTTVSVDRATRVAGRSTYQLLLAPKDERSLVQRVVLAVDGKTLVPLRVQIYAKGHSEPAFETGFTDVSFAVPPRSVFRFTPPSDATIKRGQLPTAPTSRPILPEQARAAQVLGRGWTAVLSTPFDASLLEKGSTAALVNKLVTRVPGGRELHLPLVSVFITDAGRLWAGPVTPAALRDVAASGRPL